MSIKDKVDKELSLLKGELERLSSYTTQIAKAESAVKQSVQISSDISTAIETISDSYTSEYDELQKLKAKIQELNEELSIASKSINEVDFPIRLDEIDNSINDAILGIRNIHTGITNLELKMTTELTSLDSRINTKMDNNFSALSKSIKPLLISCILLAAISICLTIYFNM